MYNLEIISPQGCNFQTGRLVYDSTDYKRTNSIELVLEKCNKYVYTKHHDPKVLVGFNIIRTARLSLPNCYTSYA